MFFSLVKGFYPGDSIYQQPNKTSSVEMPTLVLSWDSPHESKLQKHKTKPQQNKTTTRL
ncbi:hypothetical protein HanRHA438_Chr09g0389251 [Helianthus annuus]|nr:hypothetical protein HanRHA438_Chr09g0389251 [Helianthus annuus]